MRILIVDDSAIDRSIYRRLLDQSVDHRYEVMETSMGEDGLRLIPTTKPDCILLDYNLPDLNGIDFLIELGARRQPIPVVMLTGTGSEAIAVRAMKVGAQDYLAKGELTAQNLENAIIHARNRMSMLRKMDEQREALERSNRDLREFASVVSHDLKTPLQSVIGFLLLLQKLQGHVIEEEAKELINNAVSGAMNMNELIESILASTRNSAMVREGESS